MLRAGTKIQSRFVNFCICNCGDKLGHALVFLDVVSQRLVESFRVPELLVNASRIADRQRHLMMMIVVVIDILHINPVVVDIVVVDVAV